MLLWIEKRITGSQGDVRMTTQDAIKSAASALKAGVAERLVRYCLRAEYFSEERIETIIRWANQLNKEE